ncbi:nitric oxide dioxygenase [Paenibacillus cellulosilyticus]|uniref:Flavohemoprotein n=1 Tax=Paenibacillus cellulosilyticus TaxID=375489 RepID=A0A2V2Z0Y3_9BACL|nr:NO-inducible flavohemoprotein [Paenibacillus cellulosilyticus]PWW08517.1 nitric oxide dioxygenase [Paenibacillus cellulosilyticus]QKS48096.1 NO-inducible flavohemoprotein [Paenibacillus cellulosilyticus]
MLSAQTVSIIKSTVPVLAEHGLEITKTFYSRMFARHPELLNIFNHANQKQGRQQQALANAVYAAAAHIDNIGAILPAVKLIAHKHRSLGIKPEHYPIVGENLLAAIQEVLGDAATPEIIAAWGEAYGFIADAFISIEAEMYAEAEGAEGGWKDFRRFVVDRKQVESDVITSFYLVPEDGGAISSFIPGQYVTVKVNIPGAKNTMLRQYSLSCEPGKPYYRISVKREDGTSNHPDGAVSNYLHETVKVGDVLELSAPAGEFVLDLQDTRPVVLLSGGVGLTPMVSMLNTLATQGGERSVTFLHSALNGNVHALREEVLAAAGRIGQAAKVRFVYEQPSETDRAAGAFDREGRIDAAYLAEEAPKDAVYYICGPVPFMRAMVQALKANGVADESIRYEFFGPAGTLES